MYIQRLSAVITNTALYSPAGSDEKCFLPSLKAVALTTGLSPSLTLSLPHRSPSLTALHPSPLSLPHRCPFLTLSLPHRPPSRAVFPSPPYPLPLPSLFPPSLSLSLFISLRVGVPERKDATFRLRFVNTTLCR